MATNDATASFDGEIRAGSRVLSIFENPLNTRILRAHADGPQRLAQLQEKVGWSATTTVRAAVSNLRGLGALRKEEVSSTPYAVATVLTPAGEELLRVADAVEAWLALCPDGPIAPDGPEAKGAVKALAGGWSSTLMRVLANRPFTLTELDTMIPDVSYPALERRVYRMRATGQIEPVEKEGRGTPYMVTVWLRQAIAPLCAAGRCELLHMPRESAPVSSVEIEASFLLALPLALLPDHAAGTAMLAVRTDSAVHDNGAPLAGVTVQVKEGEVVNCVPSVGGKPRTWAVGSVETWLDVAIDGRIEGLRIGGARPQLALDLVIGIHNALFGARDRQEAPFSR
jgi:DNA-binding HxlR family transcriptional regulator